MGMVVIRFNESISHLFFREKVLRIFLCFNPDRKDSTYVREISKKADCEYAHTLRVLQILESSGLVCSSKIGRKRIYFSTESGKKICQLLKDIVKEN